MVPAFNEADNIELLVGRLLATALRCVRSVEILFVDDGSSDDTLERIRRMNRTDPRIRAIGLSRNFGKELAIAAGLDHARGSAAVIIDADFQQPPELIEDFVALWRQGYKNVYGQRVDRDTDSRLRRVLTQQFYRLFSLFGEVSLPDGGGDFRLLDRQAIDALRRIRERARFSKGLYAWIGFKTIGVPFRYAPRKSGASRFGFRKLTSLAFIGILSFSTLPLRIWVFFGSIVSILALMLAGFYLVRTLLLGIDVPGYASLIVSMLLLSGMQLFSLGVLGEYVARVFSEVKGRPLYLVADTVGDVGPDAAAEAQVRVSA